MPLIYSTQNHIFRIEIPNTNAEGVPVQKMPKCPMCNEDDLGTLNADVIMCYSCSNYFYYRPQVTENE